MQIKQNMIHPTQIIHHHETEIPHSFSNFNNAVEIEESYHLK